MSIAPRHDRHKKCFAYCGDDRCNCSRRRQTKKGIIMAMTDTNNTDGAALLPVTQSDREAAAKLVGEAGCCACLTVAAEAFARHLQSHSLPGDVGTDGLGSWEVPLPEHMSVDDAPHWADDPQFYADRFNEEVAQQRKMCDRRNEVNNHSLLHWLRSSGSYLRTIGTNAPVQGSHHHSCCIHAEQLFKIADHIEALPSTQEGAERSGVGETLDDLANKPVGGDFSLRAFNVVRCLANAEFRSELDRCKDEAEYLMASLKEPGLPNYLRIGFPELEALHYLSTPQRQEYDGEARK